MQEETFVELGTLEVLNPLSSNVDKYTVFVLDTGDITPGYIGEVSILIFNLPLTISEKNIICTLRYLEKKDF
jgi:hypothetical protein